MSDLVIQWVILVIYMGGMMYIGVYWDKHTKDSEGYLLGGRKIGAFITAMTLQTTSMSGYMFMGGPAQAYKEGYFTLWYAVGDGGGAIFNVGILGKRMRRLSYFMGCLSPIEYLERRYPGKATRLVAGIIAIIFVYGYVLAQFLSAGKTMAQLLGIPLWVAIIVGSGVIVFYVWAGGYMAVAWTDFFQGIVMVVSMILIFIMSMVQVGGLTGLNEALTAKDPTITGMWGVNNMYMGQWGVVAGAVLIYLVGYMGLPHVVIRHMAMESPYIAKRTVLIATVWNQLFIFIPYIIGLMGIIIIPGLEQHGDPEMVVLLLADKLLPTAISAIVLVGIMSAIMSTADAQLMLMGTMLGRDIYQRYINKDATDKQLMTISRACIAVVGIVSVLIALIQPPGVFQLVIFSFSSLGAAFLPSYVCAVWWKKANTTGAIASMVLGCLTATIWAIPGLNLTAVTGLHQFFAGLIVSIPAMIIGSQFGKPTSPEIRDLVDRASCKMKIPAGLATANFKQIAPETNGVLTFLKHSDYMKQVGFAAQTI